MTVKDVEMFVLEKRKNEALKKERDKATKKEDKLKEDKKEDFFNKKLHPIIKKYGFDFSFDDFCEYKKNSVKPQDGAGELGDDELFNVAGGKWWNLTDDEQVKFESLKHKAHVGCPFASRSAHLDLNRLTEDERAEYDRLNTIRNA